MVAANQTGVAALALLQDLGSQIERTSKSATPEAVHQLRVRIRKLTQAFRISKSAFSAGIVKKIRRRLKTVMVGAGKVRDLDIAVALLRKAAMAKSPGNSTRLRRKIEKRRVIAVRDLHRRIRRVNAARMIGRWRTWLSAPHPSGDAPTRLRGDFVARLTKRFKNRGRKASSRNLSPEKLHRLRIEAKKLRYSIELLGPSRNVPLEKVKDVQSVLGKVNDYASATRLISEEKGSKKIARIWEKKQGEKLKEFRREWKLAFPSAS